MIAPSQTSIAGLTLAPETGVIPVAGPSVTEREVAYVAEAARTAWGKDANAFNRSFEALFATYVGVTHAASLPHCTAGIHLALAALGVGPGDEVIVPDATWIASAAPISYVGATPVFVDVEPDTWCLSAEALARVITPRTRAVIPVGLYGSMPDWDAILPIAAAHGVAVIEDAAESFGSMYGGRRAGAFGRVGVFSFHGSKTMTTGEGGMLVTDDSALFDRIQRLRDHGRPPGDRMFQNDAIAFKYKMSALQAAFGLAQIERAEDLVERKRVIFGWYSDRLSHLNGVTLNAEPPGVRNSYWMVTLLWDNALGLEKTAMMAALADRRIDSRPFFSPLSSLPAYRDAADAPRARAANHVAYDICARGVNLPSGFGLTENDVDYVCEHVRAILRGVGG